MQPETLEVRNAYRAFGYLPEMYRKVADDHLSLECAFMSLLARRTEAAYCDPAIDPAGSVGALAEGQLSFLQNHLNKWIGSYACDLAEDACESLYSVAANALVAFMAWDISFLEQLAGASAVC